MVVASFSVEDEENRYYFFRKTFLLVDISMDVALGMIFFILKNDKIDFAGCYLHRKTYTIAKTFPSTRQVELIGKKKFTITALDPKNKAFIVHVAFISQDLDVYLF